MWLVSLRDLQWRRRRFAIALISTTLVLAMTQLLAGVSASFSNEEHRTITAVGADAWVVPATASGPFSLTAIMSQDSVASVGQLPGVRHADPLVLARSFVFKQGNTTDVNLIGYQPGGLGTPRHVSGRLPQRPGEIVADGRVHLTLGSVINLGGFHEKVVGLVHGMTYYAGVPTVYATLADAQALAFSGQHLITTVVTKGRPTQLTPGLASFRDRQVQTDLNRRIASAAKTITFLEVLLWIVATGIIGSMVYLSSLERVRDFAVFKATGGSTARLLAGLVVQALVLALGAALLGIVAAYFIAPRFPLAVEIPRAARGLLFVIATLVAGVASLGAMRRAVVVDPALAFEGA
jgi:putative ABC transport system permease protein